MRVGVALAGCAFMAGMATLMAPGTAAAAMTVVVTTNTPTITVALGDEVAVVFNATVSGSPDTEGECTAQNETYMWDDGATELSDTVYFTVPDDADVGEQFTVTDFLIDSYTSSCDGEPFSASGSASAVVTACDTCN